jgi:hypothetical protein
LLAEATLMARRVACRHGFRSIPALLTTFVLVAAVPAPAREPSIITGAVLDQAESLNDEKPGFPLQGASFTVSYRFGF